MLEKDIQKLKKEMEEIEVKATEGFARINAYTDKIEKCKKADE